MRNKIKYSIAILALLLGLLSCNRDEFLTPSQIPEFPWTDLATFERGAVAPYNYLVAGGWADALGVSVFMDIASSDLGAIAPTVPPANAPWGVYAYRTFRETAITPGSKGGGRQYDIFNNMYLMINASNDALSFIEKAGDGDIFPGVPTSDETVQRIKAELLFNRARAYFYLVAQFCPPYNPGGDNSEKQNSDHPRKYTTSSFQISLKPRHLCLRAIIRKAVPIIMQSAENWPESTS